MTDKMFSKKRRRVSACCETNYYAAIRNIPVEAGLGVVLGAKPNKLIWRCSNCHRGCQLKLIDKD